MSAVRDTITAALLQRFSNSQEITMNTIFHMIIPALVAACATSPDPHAIEQCDPDSWHVTAGPTCEAACTIQPTASTATCAHAVCAGREVIDFDGVIGCCIQTVPAYPADIVFKECK